MQTVSKHLNSEIACLYLFYTCSWEKTINHDELEVLSDHLRKENPDIVKRAEVHHGLGLSIVNAGLEKCGWIAWERSQVAKVSATGRGGKFDQLVFYESVLGDRVSNPNLKRCGECFQISLSSKQALTSTGTNNDTPSKRSRILPSTTNLEVDTGSGEATIFSSRVSSSFPQNSPEVNTDSRQSCASARQQAQQPGDTGSHVQGRTSATDLSDTFAQSDHVAANPSSSMSRVVLQSECALKGFGNLSGPNSGLDSLRTEGGLDNFASTKKCVEMSVTTMLSDDCQTTSSPTVDVVDADTAPPMLVQGHNDQSTSDLEAGQQSSPNQPCDVGQQSSFNQHYRPCRNQQLVPNNLSSMTSLNDVLSQNSPDASHHDSAPCTQQLGGIRSPSHGALSASGEPNIYSMSGDASSGQLQCSGEHSSGEAVPDANVPLLHLTTSDPGMNLTTAPLRSWSDLKCNNDADPPASETFVLGHAPLQYVAGTEYDNTEALNDLLFAHEYNNIEAPPTDPLFAHEYNNIETPPTDLLFAHEYNNIEAPPTHLPSAPEYNSHTEAPQNTLFNYAPSPNPSQPWSFIPTETA